MPSKKSSTKKRRSAAESLEGNSRSASKPAALKKKRASGKKPVAQKNKVAPFPVKSPGAKKSPRPPRSPHPSLKLAEALRVAGLDEVKFAKVFRRMINRIAKPNQSAKLLLDAIKEWGRHLAPERSADRAASDAPVPIQLIHNVPRPDRSGHAEDSAELRDFADATPETSGA